MRIAEVVRRWRAGSSQGDMARGTNLSRGIPSASTWQPPLRLGWPGKDLTVASRKEPGSSLPHDVPKRPKQTRPLRRCRRRRHRSTCSGSRSSCPCGRRFHPSLRVSTSSHFIAMPSCAPRTLIAWVPRRQVSGSRRWKWPAFHLPVPMLPGRRKVCEWGSQPGAVAPLRPAKTG